MKDPYQAFRDQLSVYGIQLPGDHQIKTDGLIQRFSSTSNPRKKNSWYILFDLDLDDGSKIICGKFGDFSKGVDEKVDLAVPELSAEEKKRFAQKQDEIAKKAAKVKADKQKQAADKANNLYSKLPDLGRSDYLKRKKVAAYGLRFATGAVYVPVRKLSGELVGMQYIDSAGNKLFFSGTAKEGACHVIGDLATAKRIAVVEGYATGASVYQAYKGLVVVVVAFDTGNLDPVLTELRKVYPDVSILIAGDNDVETKTPTIENPGVTYGKAAAEKHGCQFAAPVHPSDRRLNCDWNDVHVIAGLEVLRAQIKSQLNPVGGARHAA